MSASVVCLDIVCSDAFFTAFDTDFLTSSSPTRHAHACTQVKTKFAYPCGGADKNFASKINENGACEVSLPAGVWYIKAEGLMTGQAPCDGCDPYDRSDPSLFGPVLVSRKDGVFYLLA